MAQRRGVCRSRVDLPVEGTRRALCAIARCEWSFLSYWDLIGANFVLCTSWGLFGFWNEVVARSARRTQGTK